MDPDKNIGISPNAKQPTWYGDTNPPPSFLQPCARIQYEVDKVVSHVSGLKQEKQAAYDKRILSRNVCAAVVGVSLLVAIIVALVAMPVLIQAGLMIGLIGLIIGASIYGYFNHKAAQEIHKLLNPPPVT